jgi:2-keto-4-pentenoate hydratase
VSWQECLSAAGALDPVAAAGALRQGRQAGQMFDVPLSADIPLSLADAYRVQDQVTALRLADGERRAGWKLGCTSLTSARPLKAGHRIGAVFGDERWPVEVRRPPPSGGQLTVPG